MRHIRHAASLILAVACGTSAVVATTEPSPGVPLDGPTLATTPAVAVVTAGPSPSLAPCEIGEGFVDHGDIGTLRGGDDDAVTVATVRWEDHGSCERVTIQFVDAAGELTGLPAGAEASFVGGRRIIRVRMAPQVQSAVVADVVIDMTLARRSYVVRGLDGNLFLDLHLGAAATARVFSVEDPGRIVIDLQPGGPPPDADPARSDTVVVTEPLPGEAVDDPIRITGYARTSEAHVEVVGSRGRTVHVEGSATAAAWVDMWGEFTLTLRVGERGPLRLSVGAAADQADDGGATLEVEVL